MRNAKKSLAKAARNYRKPAPKRKPVALARKLPARPKRAKAATAPCYNERELTAVALALPAKWPVAHYSYVPCESDGEITMFSYDWHGRLVRECHCMEPATSFQHMRNGRPKRRRPAQKKAPARRARKAAKPAARKPAKPAASRSVPAKKRRQAK